MRTGLWATGPWAAGLRGESPLPGSMWVGDYPYTMHSCTRQGGVNSISVNSGSKVKLQVVAVVILVLCCDHVSDEEGVRYVPVRPRPPVTLLRHYRNPWKAAYHHFQRYSDIRIKGQYWSNQNAEQKTML